MINIFETTKGKMIETDKFVRVAFRVDIWSGCGPAGFYKLVQCQYVLNIILFQYFQEYEITKIFFLRKSYQYYLILKFYMIFFKIFYTITIAKQ